MDEKLITVKKKKEGQTEPFNREKIHAAIRKSADRVLLSLTDADCKKVSDEVISRIEGDTITVRKLHTIVEVSLDAVGFPKVAESYRQYRNYKIDALKIMEAVDAKTLELSYKADKSNANADSALISTKRSILYQEQQRERYKRIFLNPEELEAVQDGYLYVHDMGARFDTFNCCLCNVGRIMDGGFILQNTEYTEPGSAASAIAVMSDIMSVVAGNQYGGLTVPEVDKVLGKYAEKSYIFHSSQFDEMSTAWVPNIFKGVVNWLIAKPFKKQYENARDRHADERTRRELSQGFQGIELTYNTVSSSRGDFPFTTFSFGLGTTRWEKMVTEEVLKVRRRGQGPEGKRVPVVFPKLVFLYADELHDEGKENEDIFNLAVDTTKYSQYPDYLSMNSGSYLGDVYHRWGKAISPMGCRAFLSPEFKNSGTYIPKDDGDEFEIYRFNMGVISMNLPMMLKKAEVEGKDFFDVIDKYMDMAKGIHKRTIKYLSKLKASSNPLVFCEGGFDGGTLDPSDTIESVVKKATISFGYGGLRDIQYMHNGKELSEDSEFAIRTLKHISERVDAYKKKDGILYALYGSPGESWLSLACDQLKKKYGEVPGVTTNGYLTNSFHLHVTEEVTPIKKIDVEREFWDYPNGGKITHILLPDLGNDKGIKALIRYGMSKQLYLGVNHKANYCTECGHHWIGDDASDHDDHCPNCGSGEIVKTRRMSGYLSNTRTRNGDCRFHDGKVKEIRDRKNM